jgi:uncharacterized protein (DUF488 family)
VSAESSVRLWTIGHSTRSWPEFLELLRANEIELLADIRRFPGSRKYPHFGAEALRAALEENGISYEHLEELGGRRKPQPDSPNDVWRNDSFRGYADYMETSEFGAGISRLLTMARARRTAIMCSEAVWWRCHRSLVADYLKARDVEVIHIMSERHNEVHPYTSAARLVDGKLSYAAGAGRAAKENSHVTDQHS